MSVTGAAPGGSRRAAAGRRRGGVDGRLFRPIGKRGAALSRGRARRSTNERCHLAGRPKRPPLKFFH